MFLHISQRGGCLLLEFGGSLLVFLCDFAQPKRFALHGGFGLLRVGRGFAALPARQSASQPKGIQFGQQARGIGILAADDARGVAAVSIVALGIETGVQFGVGLCPSCFPLRAFRIGEFTQKNQRSLDRGVAGFEGFFRQADHGQQLGAPLCPAAQPGQ